MVPRNKHFWIELAAATGIYVLVVAAFFVSDRSSYRRGANDASPVYEVLLLAAMVLLFAFGRSIYLAFRYRGRMALLPLWYFLLFALMASQFMV